MSNDKLIICFDFTIRNDEKKYIYFFSRGQHFLIFLVFSNDIRFSEIFIWPPFWFFLFPSSTLWLRMCSICHMYCYMYTVFRPKIRFYTLWTHIKELLYVYHTKRLYFNYFLSSYFSRFIFRFNHCSDIFFFCFLWHCFL